MIIRKPLPRAHGLNEPFRHQDHPKPRTRREFIAQGFMAGSAAAFIPSTLGMLLGTPGVAHALSSDTTGLKGVCKISNGSGMVPFICFDLSGGGNIAGSNVLVGQQNGQFDFLSTAGYAKLGLPPSMVPSASAGTFIDTSMGIAFHSDSAFLRGMKTKMSAATMANVNGVVIPALSQNDTANNVWSPLYSIAKTGAKGSLLTLAGTSNSPSGGNSIALMSSIDQSIAPTKVSQRSDLIGLGPPNPKVPLFTGPTAQQDMVSTIEYIERISKLKLDKVDTGLGAGPGGPDELAKQQVQCGYVKPANTAEIFNGPSALDVMLDTNITGTPTSIFSAAEMGTNEAMKISTIMKLVVNGFGGAAVNQMGGFDYHSGNRSDGEMRDFSAGVSIGAALEYAARVGQPLMLQVFSDGSLNANTSMVDNSVAGRGKLAWAGDNQSTAATFFLVYNPKGRTPLISPDKQQLGWFTADGSVSAPSSPAANAVNLAVEMIVLNYLGLHGRQGEMPSIFPNTAFGSTALIDKYTAFGKM